ncbi:hypothetical protein FDP41_006100 [Naegleria fowleri]|uniref:Uncharacterized protein n=1 Tax=Naegleria fowleri TaxID=5763 RepID=A0A6A5BIJ8_NAEFO|nr:uncharacterized protein FDP41_006100 [Naegleria fowleri]KAF0974626.1 hypothetical protein FDP41_006100 [Naegleria fowleri]CAG4716182.1 unnamed protein product [Naegleria fowleri]
MSSNNHQLPTAISEHVATLREEASLGGEDQERESSNQRYYSHRNVLSSRFVRFLDRLLGTSHDSQEHEQDEDEQSSTSSPSSEDDHDGEEEDEIINTDEEYETEEDDEDEEDDEEPNEETENDEQYEEEDEDDDENTSNYSTSASLNTTTTTTTTEHHHQARFTNLLTCTIITELHKALTHYAISRKLTRKIASYHSNMIESCEYLSNLKKALVIVLTANSKWTPFSIKELYAKVFHKLKERSVMSTFDLRVLHLVLHIIFESPRTQNHSRGNINFQQDYDLYHYTYPMIIEMYEYLLEGFREKTITPSSFEQDFSDLNGCLMVGTNMNSSTLAPEEFIQKILHHYRKKYLDVALIAGARRIQNDMIL